MTRDELLSAYAAGRRNFGGVGLRGVDLSGARLDESDLRCVDLGGARLDRAELRCARLDGADLRGASLDGASLDGASLSGASLSGASLSGASLSGASLSGASLSGASLDGASLDGARLDRAMLICARLDRASLSGASLICARLDRASLSGASLDGADLRYTTWLRTRLHGTGTWSAPPPRCSAGDWHAIFIAPGIVTIGCMTLSVMEWIERGADLAEHHCVSSDDAETLRSWFARLAARTEWAGWEADT
jgi:hypothetical protein